jgi:DnaD/phage-associated family protein
MSFAGFPQGKHRLFSLPAAFITELLPQIDDLAELQVTLFCFYGIQQREGRFRYLRYEDFLGSDPLMQALQAAAPDVPAEQILETALNAACERGSILRATVESLDLIMERETLYFINAAPGRSAVEQIARGEWSIGDGAKPVEIMPERPTIYRLYEENIGPLTPMIADTLKDAELEYSTRWIEDAIRLAVENNARSWKFIQAVLERWKQEGKTHEVAQEPAERGGRRFVNGQYADFIEY